MSSDQTGDSGPAEDLAGRLEEFEQEALRVSDRPGWDELRVRWVGRKQGIVRTLLAGLKDVPAGERRDVARLGGEI